MKAILLLFIFMNLLFFRQTREIVAIPALAGRLQRDPMSWSRGGGQSRQRSRARTDPPLAVCARLGYVAPMLEGLPPNNASHLIRLVSDERRARAVADLIFESFEPAEAASTVFETEDLWPGGGRAWLMEGYF